jgi:hypothetical protein
VNGINLGEGEKKEKKRKRGRESFQIKIPVLSESRAACPGPRS